MKKKILLSSATIAIIATIIGVGAMLFASDIGMGRATGVAFVLGLLSMALFFVGLVYPGKVND